MTVKDWLRANSIPWAGLDRTYVVMTKDRDGIQVAGIYRGDHPPRFAYPSLGSVWSVRWNLVSEVDRQAALDLEAAGGR